MDSSSDERDTKNSSTKRYITSRRSRYIDKSRRQDQTQSDDQDYRKDQTSSDQQQDYRKDETSSDQQQDYRKDQTSSDQQDYRKDQTSSDQQDYRKNQTSSDQQDYRKDQTLLNYKKDQTLSDQQDYRKDQTSSDQQQDSHLLRRHRRPQRKYSHQENPRRYRREEEQRSYNEEEQKSHSNQTNTPEQDLGNQADIQDWNSNRDNKYPEMKDLLDEKQVSQQDPTQVQKQVSQQVPTQVQKQVSEQVPPRVQKQVPEEVQYPSQQRQSQQVPKRQSQQVPQRQFQYPSQQSSLYQKTDTSLSYKTKEVKQNIFLLLVLFVFNGLNNLCKATFSLLCMCCFGMPIGIINSCYVYFRILPSLLYDGLYYICVESLIKLLAMPVVSLISIQKVTLPCNYLSLDIKLIWYLLFIIIMCPTYLLICLLLAIYFLLYGLVCVWDIQGLTEASLIFVKMANRMQALRNHLRYVGYYSLTRIGTFVGGYKYDENYQVTKEKENSDKYFFSPVNEANMRSKLGKAFELENNFCLNIINSIYYIIRAILKLKNILLALCMIFSILIGILSSVWYFIGCTVLLVFWALPFLYNINCKIILDMKNRLLKILALILFNVSYPLGLCYIYVFITFIYLPLYTTKTVYSYLTNDSQKSVLNFSYELFFSNTLSAVDRKIDKLAVYY